MEQVRRQHELAQDASDSDSDEGPFCQWASENEVLPLEAEGGDDTRPLDAADLLRLPQFQRQQVDNALAHIVKPNDPSFHGPAQ